MLELNVKVPDRLSTWVRVALADARKVAKRPQVRFDMDFWVVTDPGEDTPCSVCLAGAVILQRMPVTQRRELLRGNALFQTDPSACVHDASDSDERLRSVLFVSGSLAAQLHALNSVRTGDLIGAVNQFYPQEQLDSFASFASQRWDAVDLGSEELLSLDEYGDEFVKEMNRRADFLEAHGF